MVLEARDIYRFFQVDGTEIPVLKGISFGLERGSFTTIMGPSGSGKSTLLHILAGLDRASAGSVWLDGELVPPDDEEQRTRLRRERIGFIFQFFNLLPDLTVEELRKRRPMGLSGGEMQRVSIARALVLVALISTLFVLALPVPLGQLAVSGLNRVAGLDAPYSVPWVWLAVVPVLALSAGLCSAMLPGLRACRQDPAASVRYE